MSDAQTATTATTARIEREIAANPVMLYMKGTAMFPQCGFSARVVQILSHVRRAIRHRERAGRP